MPIEIPDHDGLRGHSGGISIIEHDPLISCPLEQYTGKSRHYNTILL